MLTQATKIAPPLPSDSRLIGLTSIIQRTFDVLFQAGHVHSVITKAPASGDGNPGDIYLFDDGTNIYLYVKTGRGWAKSSAFTLI